MKQNTGKLGEADLKARTRFWNKKGFFGEPTKKQIERSSMKMQKLVKALKAFPPERVMEIRAAIWTNDFSPDAHTQCGTLVNRILIMQYQPLKYFSYETIYSLHVLGDPICIIHLIVLRADN